MRSNRLLSMLCAGFLAWVSSLGCAGDSSGSGGLGISTDVTIVKNALTKADLAFAPNPFSLSLADGGRVTWSNGDYVVSGYSTTGTTHELIEDTGLFDSGGLLPRRSFSFTFAAAGTYTYHCGIHPTMVGTITVTP